MIIFPSFCFRWHFLPFSGYFFPNLTPFLEIVRHFTTVYSGRQSQKQRKITFCPAIFKMFRICHQNIKNDRRNLRQSFSAAIIPLSLCTVAAHPLFFVRQIALCIIFTQKCFDIFHVGRRFHIFRPALLPRILPLARDEQHGRLVTT